MRDTFLPYGRQTIEEDDIEAVSETLRSDFLTTGPKVQEFEEALRKATGAKHAIAVANGTVAPHLACIMAGLDSDCYAIVPSITFLATANAPRYCGAHVIFSDVDPETGLMTAQNFEDALNKAHKENKKVKAVLPVHLTGQPADLKSIRALADQHDITVIADSCHALGSHYDGHPVGAGIVEHFSTFSFHPVKTIAMGEGGAVTTNNDMAAQKIRELRHHGMIPMPENGPWFHEMRELGYNYRLSDIQCALGVSQLSKLDQFLKCRAEIVAMYDEGFKGLAPVLQIPKRASDEFIGWHLYALKIDFDALGISRADFMGKLKEKNIGSQVHYIPIHTQPYYQGLYGQQSLVGAEHYYEKTLSIPLYPTMTNEDASFVIENIKALVAI